MIGQPVDVKEPQRINHEIWASLYGRHLFKRAQEVNEDAHIYLNMEGYVGWFMNTHANLEGFNGKELTMILITHSVKRWRKKVVADELLTEQEVSQDQCAAVCVNQRRPFQNRSSEEQGSGGSQLLKRGGHRDVQHVWLLCRGV